MTERYLKYVDDEVLIGRIHKMFKKRKNHSKEDEVTPNELKTLRDVNKVFNNVLWPATTKLQKKGITVSAAARIIATAAKGAPFLEKWWKNYDKTATPDPDFERVIRAIELGNIGTLSKKLQTLAENTSSLTKVL